MTTKLEQAAQQALGALEEIAATRYPSNWCEALHDEITALREALAEQAEQEPVAWTDPTEEQIMAQTGYVDMNHDDLKDFYLVVKLCKQLNSAPVRTKDLTDDEIDYLIDEACQTQMPYDMFARAVIAADREKNK